MELNSIYKKKYYKYKKKYYKYKKNMLGGTYVGINEDEINQHDIVESASNMGKIIHLIDNIVGKQYEKIPEFKEFLKEKNFGLTEEKKANPLKFLNKYINILLKVISPVISSNLNIKKEYKITLSKLNIILKYFNEEGMQELLDQIHESFNITISANEINFNNSITISDLEKIKVKFDEINEKSSKDIKLIEIIECTPENVNDTIFEKKKKYLSDMYLIAGHGAEDSAYKYNEGLNKIEPIQPNLIRLDGYYKFIRLTYYGDTTENNWGDFFYCLFSYTGKLENNIGTQFDVDYILNYYANKNKILIHDESANAIIVNDIHECIGNLIFKLNIDIFEHFMESKSSNPTLLNHYIITDENKHDFINGKVPPELNELRLRLIGGTNINQIIDLINLLIQQKIILFQGSDYDIGEIQRLLKLWCLNRSEDMHKKISVTNTVISDMELTFDLDSFDSKAGIFSRDQLKENNNTKIDELCGFGVAPSKGLYSNQFNTGIAKIKLSDLISSGKLNNSNFSVAGLPPGTYFMATCRVENSLMTNILLRDGIYEGRLSNLIDAIQDKQINKLREKISTYIETNKEKYATIYDELIQNVEKIIYFYILLKNRSSADSTDDEILPKSIKLYTEVNKGKTLSSKGLIKKRQEGVQKLTALRALSDDRQEEIDTIDDAIDIEVMHEVIQAEINKYNEVLHIFNKQQYNIITIDMKLIYIRYLYLNILKEIPKEQQNIFINKFTDHYITNKSIPNLLCTLIPSYDCGAGGSSALPKPIIISYDVFMDLLKDKLDNVAANKIYCLFVNAIQILFDESKILIDENRNIQLNLDELEYKIIKDLFTDKINYNR